MATAEGFEGWAILEIMGHRQVAGFVRDVVVFGVHMAMVDVPEVPEVPEKHIGPFAYPARPAIPAFKHHYSGASIFSMVETTEELARAAAARLRSQPPQPVAPTSRQLEAAPPGAYLVEDDDVDHCEGCQPDSVRATRHDSDGIPLCDSCFDALPLAERLNEGATVDQQSEPSDGGGAAAPPPEDHPDEAGAP